jgi:hypothetical protein
VIPYHFTANENLDPIQKQDLTRGEVPLSATEVFDHVDKLSQGGFFGPTSGSFQPVQYPEISR